MLRTAVIAKRTDGGTPDTDEIRGLTEAAGADIAGEVTQTRPPDPATELGAGKVDELAGVVEETGADTVVVDAELTPQQTVTLEEGVGARVLDRHRVVLEIFARQARTRRAKLQVELARLRYRLPRVRERADEGLLNRFTEKGSPIYDLRDRIDELEGKLDDLPAAGERRRETRREEGFDLVAIAGYTNAGKSTLLRRLADGMTVGEERHPDLEETAAVADRLFATLETTTRRGTIEGRDVLVTDTVGFLDDLPHWLVESFRGTLGEVGAADAVVLVADVAQSADELRRKLTTATEALGDEHPPVVTALNKADRIDRATLERRREAVADVAPDPIAISALEADGLGELERRIADELPELDRAELELPLTDGAMSLVSWLHDEAVEVDVEYSADSVEVELASKPQTIRKATARAERL